MKRIKSNINGHKYWYTYDTIYVNKGITRQTTKCLGRVDKSSEQSLDFRERKFKSVLVSKEASERATYWEKKIVNKKPFEEVSLISLELLRSKLYRQKAELASTGLSAMEAAFMIDFIYNSNKIEGSRLPISEVRRLVEQKLDSDRDYKNEVADTMKAMILAEKSNLFSLLSIKKIHQILLSSEPPKRDFRKEKVIVGNDETLVAPEKIKSSLKDLLTWVEKNLYSMYPLELAFLFYYKFERIHPFIDGNGRMGRILMNELLKRLKYHPLIVWDSKRTTHFSSFQKAVEGNLNPFLRFMIEQYKTTYDEYQGKIQKAIELQSNIDYFLTPSRV